VDRVSLVGTATRLIFALFRVFLEELKSMRFLDHVARDFVGVHKRQTWLRKRDKNQCLKFS